MKERQQNETVGVCRAWNGCAALREGRCDGRAPLCWEAVSARGRVGLKIANGSAAGRVGSTSRKSATDFENS
jgi:hypothetical protein